MTVWFDGALAQDAKVSVFDHGLLYGDGVFEGLRMEERAVFRLDDHLRRFGFGMNAIGLALPGGLERARQAVIETCRAHPSKDAYLRLVVTRGARPTLYWDGDTLREAAVEPLEAVNPIGSGDSFHAGMAAAFEAGRGR